MATGDKVKCPACGYMNAEEDLVCNLCGQVLKAERETASYEKRTPEPEP